MSMAQMITSLTLTKVRLVDQVHYVSKAVDSSSKTVTSFCTTTSEK